MQTTSLHIAGSSIMIPRRTLRLLDEAVAIEQEDARKAGKLGYMARAMIQASMPYRDPKTSFYCRQNGTFRLEMVASPNIGLPYGNIPRLLLCWLATEVVRTKDRTLTLGDSLTDFMCQIGLTAVTGGKTGSIWRLKEQSRRLFSCLTVGKMLVSLDKVINSLPNAVNTSVKSSIDQHTAHIAQATIKITDEMDRQASSITSKVVKILNDCFATSVAGIKTAAGQAETAASSMEAAKNYVGWRIIAVNIGISLFVVFIILGIVNRRFPWQLRGPTIQEQTYIERGKALTKTWSQLPPKVLSVISRAINENE